MDAAMWCLIDRSHSEHQTHKSDGQKWMQAGEGVNYTDGLFHHADSSWADRLSVKQASPALIPTGGCCTQLLWSVEDSMRCISRMGCPLFTDLKDFGQVSPRELATVKTLCDQWVSGSWRLWLTCHLFHHKACRQSPEDQSSEGNFLHSTLKSCSPRGCGLRRQQFTCCSSLSPGWNDDTVRN